MIIEQTDFCNKQKFIPPIPKFDMALTNKFEITSDSSSDTYFIPLNKQNLNLIDVHTDKRRITGILQELEHIAEQLKDIIGDRAEEVQHMATKLMTQNLLDKFKNKKYNSIATALIVHTIRQLYLPITLKKIFEQIGEEDKQVKKNLSILQNEYPILVEKQIVSFIQHFCLNLHQDPTFIQQCIQTLKKIQSRNLINGEHEHIIAATIMKLVGDYSQHSRGFLVNQLAQTAKCSDISIKNLQRRIEQNNIYDEIKLLSKQI